MTGKSIGEVKRWDITEEEKQSLVKVFEHAMETKNDELFNKTYSNHLGCNQLADAIVEAHKNRENRRKRKMEKKHSLIIELGFKEVTQEVLKELETRTTKAAKAVVDKIKRVDGYKVYSNSSLNTFTIYSPFLVTKEEIGQIKQVLKREYKKVGTIMDENGLWSEWIKK